MSEEAQMEMPRYVSHKKVWALRIGRIEILWNESARITPVDQGYSIFETNPGWASRFFGKNEDLGYFVQYEDGYTSWSPTKAFEEGYTRE